MTFKKIFVKPLGNPIKILLVALPMIFLVEFIATFSTCGMEDLVVFTIAYFVIFGI